ncbi:efflux RND transporter permease subunit [Paenibacillus doosanensis]|uniref:Swarming motility protein SwrC n=1 Tax=Paenibacillus konkukensis TaxID=2020716 RepID=A0ABY4RIT7_9BACL|nr:MULTISPECIES: efflux RND transporter permease subunit [Paenibacillus]MCS7461685.1 efflux RND transporter permease subunit [Paenibacillus doosanensis]UQZ82112.1 Swarming motility protein SwrC [Paenibacillus konkukensis]
MNLANFSVNRPVTILMIMIALTILGSIAAPLLPVDLYPNMEIPTATVSTSWSGASPGQVENQVTKRIEASMATIANVSSVTSVSRTGSSNVTVQFNFGTDISEATLTMRDRLDRVRRQLPADAEAPVVSKADPNSQPILSLSLYGKDVDLITLRDLADNVVSPAVQRVEGVASVGVSGGRVRQIQLLLDQDKLTHYGITFSQVTQALGNDNQSTDAGLVYKGEQLVPLRISGEFQSTAEISKVRVSLARGQSIEIGELGQIVDSFQDVTYDSRRNGEQSVGISVLKQSDGNTVKVADNIREAMDEIQSKLPDGVKLAVLNDSSKFIKSSINTVIEHTLLGAIFSVIILMLFLNSIRATLIIGVVIPISVISTFSMMYFSHQTINTITLGGLALGLGSLVDFAVVVLESIYRKKDEGLSPAEAAKQGTAEVGTAVLASALAQIAVFAPTLFINGMIKNFFVPMALTVSFSHIAALFAAITLVPMLAAKILTKHHDESLPEGRSYNPAVWFGRGMNRFTRAYIGLLRWSLGHRWIIILVTVGMLGGSVYLAKFVGTEMMPRSDEGQLNINISLAQGTKFEITNALTSKIEEQLKSIPDIDTIFTTVGSSGGGAFQSSATNSANISVTLKPLDERKLNTDQVVEQIRNMTQGNPGAQINVNSRSSVRLPGLGGGGGGADITVNLNGPDTAVLSKLGDMVADELRDIPTLRSVQNTLERSIPAYDMTIDRDAAAYYGISVREVMTAVRTAYQGSVATNFKTGDSQISVLVKYPTEFTNNLENLNQVVLTTSSGAQIPLSAIAKVVPGSSPAQIRHTNQQRLTTVQASVSGAAIGDVEKAVQEKLDTIQPPDGYTISLTSKSESNSTFSSLYMMLGLSVVLVYMVMASQFESLYGPFIIMFSLPPTFIGAILGLFLTHRTINMNSVMGMIMLMGIVVNNAIVLVDYTNQLRKRGYTLFDALMEAGRIRLRPILMTTATTVLAMLPLVIGFGEGAEAQASMATVVAFGLTLSTMVTLLLVPVVYTLMDGMMDFFRSKLKRQAPPTLPADRPNV